MIRDTKDRALALLRLAPALTVLNAGMGTAIDQRRIVAAVRPAGMAVGLDLAAAMLDLTRRRTCCPAVRADIRRLPFRSASFDRLFSRMCRISFLPQTCGARWASSTGC